ncbi:unnamed protein product [Owenia fusiformis]|uniref:Uncharacterized protein n=1 Tax=Owenia fusiformis TaxID=6347 RepID=A0A8S4P8Z5_OWEFU|nr:unnamed protein product [Owenia fusiformis]
MSAEWNHGLCGCLANCGTCILAFLVPCYQFGKNAEAVGDSCCCCCLMFFVPIANCIFITSNRSKVRERQGIPGSCIGDAILTIFCPFCSLAQVSNECSQFAGGMAIDRD